MLINEIKYRLGESILIEHSGVLLTRVTHIPVGAQRSGKCSIIGNILVILPWDCEEPGYLTMEFHENLIKLPIWNKTPYYCFASSIQQVGINQCLTSGVIEQLSINKINLEPYKRTKPSTFRLGRYKIIVDENGLIFWQAVRDLNRTIRGICVIESGILFLGSKELELDEEQSRSFYADLKLLPLWTKTFAWGHHESLFICEEQKLRKTTRNRMFPLFR
jgi:hypothetical protein